MVNMISLEVSIACHFERSEKSGSLFSIVYNELLRMTCCLKSDFSLQLFTSLSDIDPVFFKGGNTRKWTENIIQGVEKVDGVAALAKVLSWSVSVIEQ